MSHHKRVAYFMRAGDQPVRTTPTIPNAEEAWLRLNLLSEEFAEYKAARLRCERAQHIRDEREYRNAVIEMADALGDMCVIIYGTAHAYGINLPHVLDEICDSNDTKIVDGRLIKRADGKILKPDTYRAPDLRWALFGNPDNEYTGDEDYE